MSGPCLKTAFLPEGSTHLLRCIGIRCDEKHLGLISSRNRDWIHGTTPAVLTYRNDGVDSEGYQNADDQLWLNGTDTVSVKCREYNNCSFSIHKYSQYFHHMVVDEVTFEKVERG
ncbi:uncharacterized protein AB9W97_014685 [Spinachia spinachia]